MKQRDVVADWPESEIERVMDCPVCGHNGRRLLHKGLTDITFRCAPGMWNLHQCLQCDTAFLDPRPTPASIWRAYTNYYTHKPLGNELPLSTMGFRQRLRRALRNGYINSRYGANLQPASRLGRWVVPLLYGKQGEIDHSLRSLPRLIKGESKKVLDIGCGDGSFLRIAMQLGWVVQGIDPDSKLTSHIDGISIEQGGFPKTRFQDATFDVVTLSHVIEHTHDPVASLQEVYRLLKPGGKIWIATPNVSSVGHRWFGSHWIGLQSPGHLVLFSHKAIMHGLSTAGFNDMRVADMFPQATGYYHMSWRLALGEDPFASTGTPLPFYLRLMGLVSNLLYAFLPSCREELVVTATKPIEVTSPQQQNPT